jgi:hypothetical protein
LRGGAHGAERTGAAERGEKKNRQKPKKTTFDADHGMGIAD